jgi:uncharacterized membrane protein YphA (DoxX/SURF4 family)
MVLSINCLTRLLMSFYFIQNAYLHFLRPETFQEFITIVCHAMHIPLLYQNYVILLYVILEILGAILLLSPKKIHVRHGASILIVYLLFSNVLVNGKSVYYILISTSKYLLSYGKSVPSLRDLQLQDQFFVNMALVAGLIHVGQLTDLRGTCAFCGTAVSRAVRKTLSSSKSD